MNFKFFLIALTIFSSSLLLSAQSHTNPLNPRDEVGNIHNDVLREFAGMDLGVDLSYDQIFSIIDDIASQNQSRLDEYGIEMGGYDTGIISEAYDDFENNYANVISASSVSEESKAMMQEVIDATFDGGTTYDGFIGLVKQKESELLDGFGNTLSTPELNLMLDALSVARHSAHLWLVELGSSGGNGGNGQTLKKRGQRWWVIGADIGGFIFGNAAGALYASGTAFYITSSEE